MSEDLVKLNLTPDYCCGGGHCGPLPGYFFICPHCGLDSQCRTGYPLKESEHLTCTFCKGKIQAVKQNAEFEFEFNLVPGTCEDD